MKTSTVRYVPFLAIAALALVLAAVSSSSAAQGPPPGFALPAQAVEVAPGVFFLGTGVDNGVPVEGYAYAHHKNGHNGGPGGGADPTPTPDPEPTPTPNPEPAPTPDPGTGDASTCFSFIANGARWRSPETVMVDPSSGLGVSIDDISGWMQAWEEPSAVSGIYGSFTSDTGLEADTTSTDGLNEVYFDTIAEPGVLGYTIVWSSRIGRPSSRPIVEADIVVEDTGWSWWTGSGDIGATELDLGAVFTHEAGHYVGLGHTEQTTLCEQQTMYPSISSGDTTKQSLDVGDITGVDALYN